MFFYISKLLHFLISPSIWLFLFLLVALFAKKPRRKKRCLIYAIGIFYFFSNAFILEEAFRVYEEKSVPINDGGYDVAIVLGGFMGFDTERQLESFYSSSDRFLHALRLYKLGRVDKIMVVGGSGSMVTTHIKEGPIIAGFLNKIGVPKEDIIVEAASKNTYENAVNSAKILEGRYSDPNYILITSAYHMPRAKRCFYKVGLNVTPFSVDHQVGKRKYVLDHLLFPNTINMRRWETIFHEWMGLVSYKMMGYI